MHQANTLLDPFGDHEAVEWSLTEMANYLENTVKKTLIADIYNRYSPRYAGLSSPLTARKVLALDQVDEIVSACRTGAAAQAKAATAKLRDYSLSAPWGI